MEVSGETSRDVLGGGTGEGVQVSLGVSGERAGVAGGKDGRGRVVGGWVGPDRGGPALLCRGPLPSGEQHPWAVPPVGTQLETVLGSHSQESLEGLPTGQGGAPAGMKRRVWALGRLSGHGLAWAPGPSRPSGRLVERHILRAGHLLPLQWAQNGSPGALPGTVGRRDQGQGQSGDPFPRTSSSPGGISAMRSIVPFLPPQDNVYERALNAVLYRVKVLAFLLFSFNVFSSQPAL